MIWPLPISTQALPLDRRNAATYNARGEAFAAKGDFEWALNDFNKAISLNSRYGEAYKNRGMVHLETGQLVKALGMISARQYP